MKKIGMYNSYIKTKGGGEKLFLAAAEELSKNNQVTLICHEEIDIKEMSDYFDLDLDKVKIKIVERDTGYYRFVDFLPIIKSFKDFLKERHFYSQLKKESFDLFINNTYYSNLPNPGKKGVYLCMFPQKLSKDSTNNPIKIVYRVLLSGIQRAFLFGWKSQGIDTYDHVISISKFTQAYVKKFWGKESEILYPICDSMESKGLKKEKIILHVGRFFDDSKAAHHKKQDFLLESFKKSGLAKSGWELHFVGSVAETGKTLKYVIDLLKEAEGEPVFFHFNTPFSEVKELYNKASIYWHATGYGTDDNKSPEKQEHFGISTVEAMSAGCIPVVIDRAGQKESVINGRNGYLWNTYEELADYTKKAVEMNGSEREAFVANGKAKASEFNKKAFAKNLDNILAEML